LHELEVEARRCVAAPEHLAWVAGEVGLVSLDDPNAAAGIVDHPAVERLAGQTRVVVDDASGAVTFEVTWPDSTIGNSIARQLAGQVADGMNRRLQALANTECAQMVERVRAAEEKVNQSMSEVNRLAGELNQPPPAVPPIAPEPPPSLTRASSASANEQPGGSRIENPDWLALHEQLRRLRDRRRILLDIRTENHPEVRNLAAEIAQTEERLNAVARWIEDRPQEPTFAPIEQEPPSGLAAETPPVEGSSARFIDPERLAEFNVRLKALEEAQVNHRQAEADLRECQERAAQVAARPYWKAGMAQATRQEIPGQSLWPIAATGLTAMVGALGVASLGRRTTMLTTPMEIAAASPVPLVGVLAEIDPAAGPPARRSVQIARGLEFASEVIVAAYVVGLLVKAWPGGL
jgi:hypothetical protein